MEVAVQSGRVDRNVQRFRGGLVFKAHRLCVSLNSRLESNKEEEETTLEVAVQAGRVETFPPDLVACWPGRHR